LWTLNAASRSLGYVLYLRLRPGKACSGDSADAKPLLRDFIEAHRMPALALHLRDRLETVYAHR